MKLFKSKKDVFAALGIAFVVIGTYNSLVIQSDGFMDSQSVRFIKRLDELNGVTTDKRMFASQGKWIKLNNVQPALAQSHRPSIVQKVATTQAANVFAEKQVVAAAITEDLDLGLTEVFNAKLFPKTPKAGEFFGNLTAKDGVIESMTVSLPNGVNVNATREEMAGNVFQYELDGQILSGMIYSNNGADGSYMVTLTNGPYEGTRLKFNSNEAPATDAGNNEEVSPITDNALAQNEFGNSDQLQAEVQAEPTPAFQPVQNDNGTQMEVGSFGAPPEENNVQDVAQGQDQSFENQAQSYGFSF